VYINLTLLRGFEHQQEIKWASFVIGHNQSVTANYRHNKQVKSNQKENKPSFSGDQSGFIFFFSFEDKSQRAAISRGDHPQLASPAQKTEKETLLPPSGLTHSIQRNTHTNEHKNTVGHNTITFT